MNIADQHPLITYYLPTLSPLPLTLPLHPPPPPSPLSPHRCFWLDHSCQHHHHDHPHRSIHRLQQRPSLCRREKPIQQQEDRLYEQIPESVPLQPLQKRLLYPRIGLPKLDQHFPFFRHVSSTYSLCCEHYFRRRYCHRRGGRGSSVLHFLWRACHQLGGETRPH